ncbi:MAG: hypothetical protein GXY01_10610 [Clostridiales bacterium]|jgi:hypothetical protein|nr:hypothetical protein [Clostridiales bacterium]
MKLIRSIFTSWYCRRGGEFDALFLPVSNKNYIWELWSPVKCAAFASQDLAKDL